MQRHLAFSRLVGTPALALHAPWPEHSPAAALAVGQQNSAWRQRYGDTATSGAAVGAGQSPKSKRQRAELQAVSHSPSPR